MKWNIKWVWLIIVILIILFYVYETLLINFMVLLIVNRGILAPNCFWWKISELLLNDASGVDLFKKLQKKYGKLIPTYMYGKHVLVVTDSSYIREILDNSPTIFGVGDYKYQMFKSFMRLNVGVSNCPTIYECPWKNRRINNEYVLMTDQIHIYSDKYDQYISNYLDKKIPSNYEEFLDMGKIITSQIVFGTHDVPNEVFKIFSEANSMNAIIWGKVDINPRVEQVYIDYMNQQIDKPNNYSLVKLMIDFPNISRVEMINQIPHWIFPIVGIYHTAVPRLLMILYNHPHVLNKLINEITADKKTKYLRWCILELLRLNNPVITTFRTLLYDFKFNDGKSFKKGTHFLILNNPILRTDFFKEPNKYIPTRWENINENSYNAIMFNQGPQRCPGKELAIFLIQDTIINYLSKSGILTGKAQLVSNKIDTNNIPQMMNPCNIKVKVIGTG